MGTIIEASFGEKSQSFFSADVYTNNRELYRLEIHANSLYEAYTAMMMEFRELNLVIVQCVAIYAGKTLGRLKVQAPLKVWNYTPTNRVASGC